VEPTEEQYLIINALDTLKLLIHSFYDEEEGIWYIGTPSPVLSTAKLLPNGDIVPINF
jgi:hypothetical protein